MTARLEVVVHISSFTLYVLDTETGEIEREFECNGVRWLENDILCTERINEFETIGDF